MANNELSGPAVTVSLAKWIATEPRRYTYRIVFIPETIGSITYLSKNLQQMKQNIVAGFNVTCVGDERAYSYLPSRNGSTPADRAALNILRFNYPNFIHYSFMDRGSDERQYCSPGVDLPVVSLMRSKYGAYPEYHTSLDSLNLVTPAGLQGGFSMLRDCLELLERNKVYRSTCLCEPHLSRHGLYGMRGAKKPDQAAKDILDFIAYADGRNDLIDISNIIRVPASELYNLAEKLKKAGLIVEEEELDGIDKRSPGK
jgi:aminopeptidase-like protein